MSDDPDEVTTLIAATLVQAHAAPKATLEQLASRTADFLPLAAKVRDALSVEGWLNDAEDQVIARRVLDLRHIQKALRDEVAMMVGAEREKHRADGRAEERRLWMEGKGDA